MYELITEKSAWKLGEAYSIDNIYNIIRENNFEFFTQN